ncbi:MAG: MT-A70 family methyltransferase [Thermoguttaceae bacterium]
MSTSRELVLPSKAQHAIDFLTQAKQYLAKARRVEDVMHLRAQAQAAKTLAAQFYAKQADLCKKITLDASAIMVLAEWRLGKILKTLPLAKSTPRNRRTADDDWSHDATGPVYLKDIPVSKSHSSRAQQIASLPASTVERYVHNSVNSNQEPTIAAALRLAKQHRANASVQTHTEHSDRFVTSLQTLIDAGCRFRTIVADPPWSFDDKATRAAAWNHYTCMSIEQIAAEPVAQVAADSCFLLLWCTSAFLKAAFEVMQAWGFEYTSSSFVWVKPQMGLGNYFRMAHEYCLLGRKGNPAFLDHSQRSWLEADRTSHSTKPEQFRSIVEKVSPGPYLEMYGRVLPKNSAWIVFGNQLNDKKRSTTRGSQ